MKKKCKLYLISLFTTFILLCSLWLNTPFNSQAAPRVQPLDDSLVIVIDPGHGGSNEGTKSGNTKEKFMCMTTAMSMYEELTKYDNVQVYLTHTDDRDMSLLERAEFAASVNADFLFSLHYNASENHTMYGSEVWISSMAPYHSYGYQFGYQHLLSMRDEGLFLRGVKTRLNEDGTDYYGIIRESAALSIPAVIIEHCYVDHERDIPYCETEEEWKHFGKLDALSVAKYFGLSSTELGVDYSEDSLNLQSVNASTIVQSTLRDETDPDVCILELKDTDYNTGIMTLQVTAADYDSPLMYYDYSIDGGETYSELFPWPDFDALAGTYTDTFTLKIQVESGVLPNIIFRAYNTADLDTESNPITILQGFLYDNEGASEEKLGVITEESSHSDDSSATDNQPSASATPEPTDKPLALQEKEKTSIGTTTFLPANAMIEEENEKEQQPDFLVFLQLCLFVVILIFIAVLVSQSISFHRRKKRRRQRIKELEESKYQPR